MLPDYYTDPNTTLIRDFNAGKGPAFETIYNQYFPVIYRFCLSLIEKSDEAEDITQETFLKLFQLNHTIDNISNVRAFLYVTSRNACMDYFRYEKKKEQAGVTIFRQISSAQINDELDGLYFETVKKAIQKLPQRQKEVLEKLYLQDIDHRTAAKQMDITLDTLYVLRSRAVSLLKKIVLARNVEEGVLLFFIVCSCCI